MSSSKGSQPSAPAALKSHRLLPVGLVGQMHGAERLTDDGRLKMDPVFVSADELVFSLAERANFVRLMRLRVGQGSLEAVHPDAARSEFEAAVSPDGRYLAFVRFESVTNTKLVIRDLAADTEALFDPGSGRAEVGNPAIAPDGSRVVCALVTPSGRQLVSVAMDGSDRRDLTQTAGLNDWPAFSPDGRRIAFGSTRDGDYDLYVMNADGSEVRRLTHSPGRDMRPAWSPDGGQLAFTSARGGALAVFVMNADGSDVRRVSGAGERDDYPAWHPDGRHLVVVSERQGRCDLYRIAVA